MMKSNHVSVRAEHDRTNETTRTGANRAGQNNQITDCHSTAQDPLQGWFDLAKPSRDRKPKSAWKRKQRGDALALVQAFMAGASIMLTALAWWTL